MAPLDRIFVRLLAFRRVAAGNATKDDDVGNGITAEAVGTMDAAGYLARCVQAGDNLSVDADDLCFGVDLNSAHGVVYGGHRGEA